MGKLTSVGGLRKSDDRPSVNEAFSAFVTLWMFLASATAEQPEPQQRSTYSTLRPPPDTSRVFFNKQCRLGVVPGWKEGRHWYCKVEDWHRARERRPIAKVAANDRYDVDALLSEAGIRPQRGGR